MPTPLVAITTDRIDRSGRPTAVASIAYAEAVAAAGGLPVLLPPRPESAEEAAHRFDAYVLTGGDDPSTEPFGVPTHPKAVRIHESRQAFEVDLLRALERDRPDVPVLGVCLGMQLMALVAGGVLDQHMPDTTRTHADHWEREHAIVPHHHSGDSALRSEADTLGPGTVASKHRQAVADPGHLVVAARAHDGVIEAVADPARRCYLGVQWHPERTSADPLGLALFRRLARLARR